ncbi:hypothetical protein [Okeania sp.]|uniref:hypothetical protein n=1 Tax=Okeania sp. TaxID=3100323 RepID=UPI002B4AAFA7|nr:hypothetical protein [Okeania sp.]MEB3342750.1 hypothetical protein [Okeania sp.]
MLNYRLIPSSGENLNRNKKYIIFGDSHSQFFGRRQSHKDIEIHLHKIPAASMTGFGKRESTLKVADQIRQKIYEYPDLDLLILKFGQVDVDLGYYYRLVVKQENIKFIDFAEKVISMYFDFINSLALEKSRIYILGINLPSIFNQNYVLKTTHKRITRAIQDKEKVKELKTHLFNHLPDIYERTNRSILFNKILNIFCQKNNLAYGDFLQETLDRETGILKKEFHLPKDNDAHFINNYHTWKLYGNKLQLISSEQDKMGIKTVQSLQTQEWESRLIKLREWQSKLEEIKDKLKQIKFETNTIDFPLISRQKKLLKLKHSLELILAELGVESEGTEIYFNGDRLITRKISGEQTSVQPLNNREGGRSIAQLNPPGNPGSDQIKVLFRVDESRFLRITVEDLLTNETLLNEQVVVQLS